MFTTEEIKNAMNRIFNLFPVEEVKELLGENCDVADAVKLDVVVNNLQRTASDVYLFTYASNAKETGTDMGKCLFDQKAAWIGTLSNEDQQVGGNMICSENELWLLEDMTFAHIFCLCNIKVEDGEYTNRTECRTLVRIIRDREDLFFSAAKLLQALEDIVIIEGLKEESPDCDKQ